MLLCASSRGVQEGILRARGPPLRGHWGTLVPQEPGRIVRGTLFVPRGCGGDGVPGRSLGRYGQEMVVPRTFSDPSAG